MARALEGVTVVDLGQIYNGPYCSMLLSYLGAEVIKVEPPGGESMRWRARGEESPAFMLINPNKRGICLDLKTKEGREILLDLVRDADVVVENFAAGVMDRLGLSYETLSGVNPRVIVASGKGYGNSGPHRDYPAMDITVQAMTGVVSVTGFPDGPPVKAGVALADFMGGVHLMAGIVTALYQRERTGRGQYVEVSMQDAVLPSLTSNLGGFFQSGGTLPERTGNRHGGLSMAPYNVYPASDGWVAIFVVTARHWAAFAREMDREDLAEHPDYVETTDRAEKMDEIDALISAWTREFPKDELVRRLLAARVPCAPVRTLSEVVEDPHVGHRGMLPEVEHPTMGPTRVYGSPIRLSDSETPKPSPAPLLGEHTAEVLQQKLGLDEDEVARLRDEGVFG